MPKQNNDDHLSEGPRVYQAGFRTGLRDAFAWCLKLSQTMAREGKSAEEIADAIRREGMRRLGIDG